MVASYTDKGLAEKAGAGKGSSNMSSFDIFIIAMLVIATIAVICRLVIIRIKERIRCLPNP